MRLYVKYCIGFVKGDELVHIEMFLFFLDKDRTVQKR